MSQHFSTARPSARHSSLQPALAALILLASMSHAQAQSYQLSAYTRSHAADFLHNDDKTDFQNFDWLDKPQALTLNSLDTQAQVVSGGKASAKVLASIGMLKAYAFASYPYGYDAQGHLVQYGYGNGTAQASFFDTLVVSSNTLAIGTPVSYRMDFTINGTLSSPNFELGGYLSASGIAEMRLRDRESGETSILSWNASTQATGVYSLVLNTQVGHTLSINGMLYAGADVGSYAQTGRSTEADFYHSAYYQLTPSDSGLNTTGLSGHNFLTTAVPEPASYALLALGLGLLGFIRRRS